MKPYITVKGVQVDIKIFTTKFCCDYEKCEGACCHKPLQDVGLLGGKLLDWEAAEILYYRKLIAPLCHKCDREIVTEQPVEKWEQSFFTSLNNGRCVFCNLHKRTCMLKGLKVNNEGIDIPIHCNLYPIVWETTPFNALGIGDTFDEYCIHGYEKGERENVYLLDFAKNPLIRNFGKNFYYTLKKVQKSYL